MMDQALHPHFGLIFRDDFDDQPIREFVEGIRTPKLNVDVKSIPPMGPMVGIEWLMPTAVMLYIAKSYFDTFLKEAGKDHYALVKRGLSALWLAYLSPKKQVTIQLVGSRGKLDRDQRYSHVFSIYTPTLDGVDRIKFLFDETCEDDAFDAYVHAILTALDEYFANTSSSVLYRAIKESGGRTPPFVVRFNSETRELEVFDPLAQRFPKS